MVLVPGDGTGNVARQAQWPATVHGHWSTFAIHLKNST